MIERVTWTMVTAWSTVDYQNCYPLQYVGAWIFSLTDIAANLYKLLHWHERTIIIK